MSRFEQEYAYPLQNGSITIDSRYTPAKKGMPTIVAVPCNGADYDNSLIRDNTQALVEAGYGVCRISPTDEWLPQTRRQKETALSTHLEDIRYAAEHFRREHGATAVYGIGHSLGGLAVVLCSTRFPGALDKVIALDPSHPNCDIFEGTECKEEEQAYYSKYGQLMGSEALVKEFRELTMEEVLDSMTRPTLVINAKEGVLHEHNEGYKRVQQVDAVDIDGADHSFTSPTARKRQITSVLNWLE